MNENLNPMDKFDFLIGRWKMEYRIPKSRFSEELRAEANGEFKRALKNKYVTFEYQGKMGNEISGARGIFAWDAQENFYRYWWFEDSGSFDSASCNFIDDNTLCMNWQKSTFVQSFKKTENGDIILRMQSPQNDKEFETVMEVIFTREN